MSRNLLGAQDADNMSADDYRGRNVMRKHVSLTRVLAVTAVLSLAFTILGMPRAPWYGRLIVAAFVFLPVALPLTLLVLARQLVWHWLIAGSVIALLFAYAYAHDGHRTLSLFEHCFFPLFVAGQGATICGCARLCVAATESRSSLPSLLWAFLAAGSFLTLAYYLIMVRLAY